MMAISTKPYKEIMRCENCRHYLREKGKAALCIYNGVPRAVLGHYEEECSDWEPKIAKADQGKEQLILVPTAIIRAIARVREYGTAKYGDPDNWKTVEPERYKNATCRHLLAYIDDPAGVDEESGLPHLHHVACNVAFLIEMEGWDGQSML